MKLVPVLLVIILTYVTADSELLKFRLFKAYDREDNEWIRLGINNIGNLYQVNVMQEITDDDWMLQYNVYVDRAKDGGGLVPFCGSTRTIQNDNIVQLLKSTLGLENQECPIQRQVITNPKNTVEGYLELDDYQEDDPVDITFTLMKGDQWVLTIILNAGRTIVP